MNESDTELHRARRVADMMTSCHSVLRDQYAIRSSVLDIAILTISACVAALGFVDPAIAEKLSFAGLTSTMTIGILGLAAFVLSLFQLRVDWKQRSDRHEQAAKAYASVKLALGDALRRPGLSEEDIRIILRDYNALGDRSIPIPERRFSRLQQRHLRKIEISKALQRHPGTSVWVIRMKLWLRDSAAILRTAPASSTESAHLPPHHGIENGGSNTDRGSKVEEPTL